MQRVQKTWSIGTGLLFNAPTQMFSKQPFFDSGRKKKQRVLTPQALTTKPAICFPEIVYITVILSYVSASDCSLNRLNL